MQSRSTAKRGAARNVAPLSHSQRSLSALSCLTANIPNGRKRTSARFLNERRLTGSDEPSGKDWNGRLADIRRLKARHQRTECEQPYVFHWTSVSNRALVAHRLRASRRVNVRVPRLGSVPGAGLSGAAQGDP